MDLGQAAQFFLRLAKRVVDLLSVGTGSYGFVQRVLPVVAHEASQRAFLVGQENGEPINKSALGGALFFQ